MKRKLPTSSNSSVSSLPFYPPSASISSNNQQNKKNRSSTSKTNRNNINERERGYSNKENKNISSTSNRNQDYQIIDNLFSHLQSTITSKLTENDINYQEKRQKLLENSQISLSNYSEYIGNVQKKEIPSLVEWKESRQGHFSSSLTGMTTSLDQEMMMKLTKKNDFSVEVTSFFQNQSNLLKEKVKIYPSLFLLPLLLLAFLFGS
jgi:hypothetical protein